MNHNIYEWHMDRKKAMCFNDSLDAFKLSQFASREQMIRDVKKFKDYIDKFYENINQESHGSDTL